MANFKTLRRKVRRPLETGGVMLLEVLIPLLPRSVIVGLSKLIGRVAMLVPTREKSVGLKNLDAVFGTQKSVAEKRKILEISFATFTLTMLDLFWFSRNPEKRISNYVTFEACALRDSFFEDKPLVCITAHMGNWEVMGQAAALQGADLASIAATLKNKAVDTILIKQRERTGQTIIPQKGALKTLISRFRKKGKAAFVLDQNTDVKDGGIVVDFLGLPMPVSPAPATLAYRTGTEIIFGFCIPKAGGHYCITFTKIITPPPFQKSLSTADVATELTRQIQDEISTQILQHPEFWLWSYKHWRRNDGVDYPAHYPEY